MPTSTSKTVIGPSCVSISGKVIDEKSAVSQPWIDVDYGYTIILSPALEQYLCSRLDSATHTSYWSCSVLARDSTRFVMNGSEEPERLISAGTTAFES